MTSDATIPTASVATSVAATASAKAVLHVQPVPGMHWVGDGFAVYGMFGYNGAGVQDRSPFLMLDYAAPTSFTPNPHGPRRGVGQHPHRGFETVTIVYAGQVAHRDSSGAGGEIGPGDVQWMTAGAGVIHDEFHAEGYSREGGPFEMVQLWVNLPARHKMTAPRYQAITSDRMAHALLPGQAGRVRVIAGTLAGVQALGDAPPTTGPAQTFTPMCVADISLRPQARASLPQQQGWSTLLLVRRGSATVNGQPLACGELITLSTTGCGVDVANPDPAVPAELLLMAGAPLGEPVVGYGPFVMNTPAEIHQAFADFRAGRFGQIG